MAHMDELGDAASKAAFVLGHEHCDERFGEATQQLGSTKMAKDVIRAAATLNVEPRATRPGPPAARTASGGFTTWRRQRLPTW